ncbi:MAG TPA: FlgO family outer membrane protein [Phycisphaerae bacterium]|nr:FlgO family outer membrane protein [Phycisphaerae bacterium]
MMRRTTLSVALVGLGAMFLLGCNATQVRFPDPVDLVAANYDGVDQMLRSARENLPANSKIMATTFVNVDDLKESSTAGRLLGGICSARLTQRGYNVINLNVRDKTVVIRPGEGEFLLSREMRELVRDQKAQAVLVGTYTVTKVGHRIRSLSLEMERADPYMDEHRPRTFEMVWNYLYVSLRLIKTENNSVIGAHDYMILCDDGVESLLGASGGNVAME